MLGQVMTQFPLLPVNSSIIHNTLKLTITVPKLKFNVHKTALEKQ